MGLTIAAAMQDEIENCRGQYYCETSGFQ